MDKAGDRAEAQATRLRSLMQRHETMTRARIEAETELTYAMREDKRVRQDTNERYGTSDPAELRAMRDTMLNDNDAKLDEFEACLDSIETDLANAHADG